MNKENTFVVTEKNEAGEEVEVQTFPTWLEAKMFVRQSGHQTRYTIQSHNNEEPEPARKPEFAIQTEEEAAAAAPPDMPEVESEDQP